jgi:protein TonB
MSLERGGAGAGPPIALGRGGGTSSASTLALAGTSAPGVSSDAPAKGSGSETTARRMLAGASLAGPIADRAVLHSMTPAYPEWAKRDGVEGSVTVYFVVRADGTVKEDVMIQKTAGFSDFDDNARAAILAWRFEPLHGGRTGEQWGTITFNYRLRGAP